MAITVSQVPPAGETELRRAEADLGSPIPGGYRVFLQASDGGRPVEGFFSPRIGVTDFLGVKGMVGRSRRLRGRLPEKLLPIADAEGGNLVCISVAEDDAGAIYFWDHQLEHRGDQAAEKIADSFDEFVARLRKLTESELPPLEVISVEIDPEFLKMVKEQEAGAANQPTLRWPPDGD